MTAEAQPERAELATLLEGQASEAESPPSREAERVQVLRAYLDSLRGAGRMSARTRLSATRASAEVIELASALLDHLAVDRSTGELLSATYQRVGAFESEVLSLAIELTVAETPRRERIRQRLADLVKVEGREGVFRALVSAAQESVKTDLLLRLQECAIEAGAVSEFVSLADESIASQDPASTDALRELEKAKARALASDPADQGQASKAYKELIEHFEHEDDVRSFEAFAESRPSAQERQRERRWLYEWRASKSANRADVLASWARAEEEYGEPNAAIAVYDRLFATDPTRKDALEALARLKLDAGDYEAALEPLRALREMSDEAGRRAIGLGIARLLLEEVGRPGDAAEALAPLLAVAPPIAGAREMAQRLIADPAAQVEVVERFEHLANAADAPSALRIFVFLVESREETQSSEQRRRWLLRVVALAAADPQLALPALVKGACELPDALPLWEAAERIARELGMTDAISLAYFNVLASGAVDPALAETIGRRMASFEGECATDSSRLIDALQRVLELAPEARWALDRVKLAMGSQGRWDELFQLYDRAVNAARSDRERMDLLEEAAFAAKDLAVDPARAIKYLELGHALRPDDASIHTSLERLYERHGRTQDLIDLLAERIATSKGFERRQLRRRIAELWLDIGRPGRGVAVVQQGIDHEDASVLDMALVLERLVRSTGVGSPRPDAEAREAAEQAIALLRGHYEKAGQLGDVVRLAETRHALAADAEGRAQSLRELIDACLHEAAGEDDPFARVLVRVETYVAPSPSLAQIAYKMLLVRAIAARKKLPSSESPPHRDAQNAAWMSIARLNDLFLRAGDTGRARTILHRGSRLPFERGRKRELLALAALSSKRPEDRDQAILLFGELFEADPGDAAAAKSLTRFAELLDETGQHARLADVFEEQGRLAGALGRTSEQCTFWERAARLWEGQGAEPRAIFAYEEGAVLGSEASFEALARIHTKREQWADAVRALEWLYAHATPSNRSARAMRLSEAYVALGERQRARACLEEALRKTDTDDADTARQRLIALYRQDAVWAPLARVLAEQARRMEDTKEKVAYLREAADLWRSRLSEPSQAALLLEEAIGQSPGDAALRPALADVLEELERWSDAAAALKGQIDWYGDLRSKVRALTHQRRARALIRAGQTPDALGELRVAADMLPGEPSILHDLARIALELGQLELSESTYRVLLLALHQKTKTGDSGLPERAAVFLDLSEIALLGGDAARAADLVDSAFDAAADQGDESAHLEETLGARGRYDLLARALERRVRRAATLTARAIALGHLASVWSEQLGKSDELAPRILDYAEAIGRDIDREDVTGTLAWTALSAIHTALGEEAARLGGRDRLAALLDSTISKTAAGAHRSELRLTLARMLLQPPARSDAAIALLSALRKDHPALVEATELLSSALEHESRFEDLATLLQERLATPVCRGNAGEFAKLTWRLGRALEETGRAAEALPAYEAILDRSPIDRDILRELAPRLERLGSARFAECLELWMPVDAQNAAAIAERLLALRDAQGDVSGAARALEAAFAANARNSVFRERLVRAYEMQGQWPDAVRVLRRAADAEPDDRTILQRLAQACLAGGECLDGIRVLDAAIARGPLDAELLRLRATLHEAVGADDGARSDLERAADADASSVPALVDLLERIVARGGASAAVDDHTLRLVDLLIGAGEASRGRRYLAVLLERQPNHIGALSRTASLAATEGNWEDAAAAYRKLLSRLGKDHRDELSKAAGLLVDIYDRAGHVEQAREPIERALDVLPESPDLLRHLERICEASGDLRRLSELLLLRANQESHAAEKSRLRLRAAGLLLDAGAPSDAAALVEQARATDPENVEAAVLQARAYVAFGRAEDALAVLGKAALLCHGKRTPLLARIYLEMGKAHLAADAIFEALEALDYGFAVDRRNDEAALLLGLVAIDLDDEKTAERALSAITTMPSRRDAAGVGSDASTKALAFYHLASLAYSKGDIGKARRLAGKAIGCGDPAHSAARALLERLDVHGIVAGPPV